MPNNSIELLNRFRWLPKLAMRDMMSWVAFLSSVWLTDTALIFVVMAKKN